MRQLSSDTRESIVQNTVRLLSKRTFGEITTREIAQSAGVAEATLFRYFPHKVDILAAVVDRMGESFFADLGEILDLIDDPVGRLVAVCRRLASFAAKNRDLIAVLHRQISVFGPESERCLTGYRRILDTIQGILLEGMKKGAFRPDIDVETTTLLFGSALHHVLMAERVYQRKARTEAGFMRSVRRFHEFLFRSIVAKEARP